MCIKARKFSDTVQTPSSILFFVMSSVLGTVLAHNRYSFLKICLIDE